MHITDPIADLLTRVRNANRAKHAEVEIPASKMKIAIAKILVEEGYVLGYEVIENTHQGVIKITLKYGENRSLILQGLKRVSKPGLRIYTNVEDMPKVMNGLGVAILSTPKGVITDKKARELNVGGEILAFVW